jgi:hypothetical protein
MNTYKMSDKMKRTLEARLSELPHPKLKAALWKGFAIHHDLTWPAIELLMEAAKTENNGVCKISGNQIREVLRKVGL